MKTILWLTDNSKKNWIHPLIIQQQIRRLVSTSRELKKYIRKTSINCLLALWISQPEKYFFVPQILYLNFWSYNSKIQENTWTISIRSRMRFWDTTIRWWKSTNTSRTRWVWLMKFQMKGVWGNSLILNRKSHHKEKTRRVITIGNVQFWITIRKHFNWRIRIQLIRLCMIWLMNDNS